MKRIGLYAPLSLLSACAPQPARQSWAAVVSIAPAINPKWDSDRVIVTVRTQDGLVGTAAVPLARLACRVGDTVRVTAQGLSLTLDKGACVR